MQKVPPDSSYHFIIYIILKTKWGKQSHWNLPWYEMPYFLNIKTRLSQKSPNGRNSTWSNFVKIVEPWALPGSGLWCILIIALGGQRKSDIDRCVSYRAQAHPPSHPPAPHPQEVSRNYGWISISPPSGSSDHGAESLMTNTYFLTLERGFSITETTLIITRFPPWILLFIACVKNLGVSWFFHVGQQSSNNSKNAWD